MSGPTRARTGRASLHIIDNGLSTDVLIHNSVQARLAGINAGLHTSTSRRLKYGFVPVSHKQQKVAAKRGQQVRKRVLQGMISVSTNGFKTNDKHA